MQNEIEKPISNSISHTSMPFASIDKNNPIEENMKNFSKAKYRFDNKSKWSKWSSSKS